MATLSNCKRCGKVFPKEHNEICSQCIAIDEENIKIVKNYISSLSNTNNFSIQILSQNTGVDLKDIMRYIKKRRLLDMPSSITLNCKICGTELQYASGGQLICSKCKVEVKEIIHDIESKPVYEKPKDDDGRFQYGFKKH